MTSPIYTPFSPTPADLLALVTLEYEQLKGEQLKRIATRDGLIYATLASVAAVLGVALKLASPLLLLVLPPAVLLLGWTYLANDRKVSEIGAYIRTDLVAHARILLPGCDPFGWETRHRQAPGRRGHKVGQMVVDLTAFCLPAAASLAVLLCSQQVPGWAIVAALVELAVTAVLADQIVQSADLGHHGEQGGAR